MIDVENWDYKSIESFLSFFISFLFNYQNPLIISKPLLWFGKKMSTSLTHVKIKQESKWIRLKNDRRIKSNYAELGISSINNDQIFHSRNST